LIYRKEIEVHVEENHVDFGPLIAMAVSSDASAASAAECHGDPTTSIAQMYGTPSVHTSDDHDPTIGESAKPLHKL
jgi:hypothetical protein